MQIIDGYCDVPNIYADDIGEYNISLFGAGDYVLSVGEKLGYELISNNELKIKDGIFLTQGRRGIIKKGSSEICIIENGTQAEKRNDLVVIEYARDEATQVESHSLKVVKGTPGEEAADPEIITGDISSGAVLHQMPLYRVRLDGLNVVAVEPLFEIGNVSPETVDPMTATEEGFAADAKLTGDAIREVSAKIDNKDTFIVPNYGSIKSVGNNFTVPAKGWIYMRSQHDVVSTENKSTILLINGIKIWETSVGVSNQVTHWEIASSGLYPVKQNDIIRYSVSHMVATLYFISAESIN